MKFSPLLASLSSQPKRWLVTGVAGFIGSNLAENLLRAGQTVLGLDNFSTGSRTNLEDIKRCVGAEAFRRFEFVEGDILHTGLVERMCKESDIVLHQAALGSVPRSIEDPFATHQNNVDGFVSVLLAAKAAGISRVVYASSSSVYGDSEELPKEESIIGQPLSPYAASKLIDEIYGSVFARCYGMSIVGLRYFNVFGPRQNPNGAYAAVIPRWIETRLKGEDCTIYGDGETSRDFCFVNNVVAANLLGATTPLGPGHRVYNVAVHQRTTLKELYTMIDEAVCPASRRPVRFEEFRAGDIKHSFAEISRIQKEIGYEPEILIPEGLKRTVQWYADRAAVGAERKVGS